MALALSTLTLLTACSQSPGDSDNDKRGSQSSVENPTGQDHLSNGKTMRAVGLNEVTQSGAIAYDNFSVRGPYYTNTDGTLGIPFSYNESYGYSNVNGTPIIENMPAGNGYNFSEGYAIVGNTVIDTAGQRVCELPEYIYGGYFQDGQALFVRTEQIADSLYARDYNVYIAVLDKNMKFSENMVILPDGMHVSTNWFASNSDGVGCAFGLYGNKSVESSIGIVNTNGEIIASFNGEKAYQSAVSAFSFVNISAAMSHSSAIGLTDTDLTKMIFAKNGYVNVMNDSGKWGLMSIVSGQMVIDYQYDYVGAYSDGVIPVCQYGTWGAIDMNGNVVIPCQSYKYISAFVNGRAIAISSSETVCVIDKSGSVVGTVNANVSGSTLSGTRKSMFYTDFSEGTNIACIYLYKKAWLVSNTGEILLSIEINSYDDLEDFLYMNNDYVVVQKKDGYHVYEIQKEEMSNDISRSNE